MRCSCCCVSCLVVLVSLLAPGSTSAQDEVFEPVVREPVSPQVQETNLLTLTMTDAAPVWREGDPVRVVDDLKEGLAPLAPQEEPPSRPDVREPVTPDVRHDGASALPAVRRWRPGDAVSVMSDLKSAAAPGGPAAPAALQIDFDGIPATGYVPPDTVGDVGPDHYVQMVNSAFAVFDKQGNTLVGPSPINSLWAGFGGPCESQNSGDPIVRYDHLADRWVLSQFALPSAGNYHQCFAVSRTSDPVSGGWNLYAFPTVTDTGGTVFPDYPKIGVWPDGYYMGTQRGYPSSGLDVWVFDREKMLSGAAAGVVQFQVGAPSLLLMPSDLDGPAPPSGTPNYFVRHVDGERHGGVDRIEVYAFKVDWSNPASSTFARETDLPTAPFDPELCGGGLLGSCVPQPGTQRKLETLTPWLMWRAQYRHFGSYDTIVTNHTVDANGRDLAGVRWYELRRASDGSWSVHQEATHSPDDVHRWMGSAAMDGDGNIAVGYSVSSASVYPGIRFATRAAHDPSGTLPFEGVIVDGSGSQTHTSSRWGNYSSMDVDPSDDCTFWYTTEYYDDSSSAGWRTRIASFRLPDCGVRKTDGFQYAAKIVCGIQKPTDDAHLAPGMYATSINIHNPSNTTVEFSKRLALTLPPAGQKPGAVIEVATDRLDSGQALKVDCVDLRRRLDDLPQLFEGFLVIESATSLDVAGVYTMAAVDRQGQVSSSPTIDVESIPERILAVGPPPEEGCPDLTVLKVGSPEVSCSGGSCVTEVKVTIANIGSAPSGPFQVRAVFDPSQSVTVDRTIASGLAPGEEQVWIFSTPRGGNCFDPDCTICVTVDSKNTVTECNEQNNRSCDTTIG